MGHSRACARGSSWAERNVKRAELAAQRKRSSPSGAVAGLELHCLAARSAFEGCDSAVDFCARAKNMESIGKTGLLALPNGA